jgi:putative DNA primase/helicase
MNLQDVLSCLQNVRACSGYYIARCPAHDDRTPSLSIREAQGGHIWLHCFAGCSFEAIRGALRRPSWQSVAGLPRPCSFRNVQNDAGRQRRNQESALRFWHEAGPGAGTLVETYLRSRFIALPIPPSLKFHPNLRHPSGVYLPAMIAAVQAVNGAIVAIHRTFLKRDGTGKADVEPNKMMLGRCVGGAVRFAKPNVTVALAEGLETALSVAQACPGLAVWAALSTSGLIAVRLPEFVHQIIICVDNDINGAGERAARTAAQRLVKQGRKVRFAWPGCPGADFNDLRL